MATKNYMINDKWLDLDKQNIVELQSVDGVLNSMKVNGSEIVTPSGKITITENGTDIDIAQYALADVNVEGGSSDFSTAEVTVVNNTIEASPINVYIYHALTGEDEGYFNQTVISISNTTRTVLALLNNGVQYGAYFESDDPVNIATDGGVTYDADDENFIITGDGTITISAGE